MPCDGTRRRKKEDTSETIGVEIPLGMNGSGCPQEAWSVSSDAVRNGDITAVEMGRDEGTTEAPCVTHDGVLENIKNNSAKRVTGPQQRKLCEVCVDTPGSRGVSC